MPHQAMAPPPTTLITKTSNNLNMAMVIKTASHTDRREDTTIKTREDRERIRATTVVNRPALPNFSSLRMHIAEETRSTHLRPDLRLERMAS